MDDIDLDGLDMERTGLKYMDQLVRDFDTFSTTRLSSQICSNELPIEIRSD